MNLVIDTWVLFQAKNGEINAINLLNNVLVKKHKIYVDSRGAIIKEYQSARSTIIIQWLQAVGKRGIVKVTCKKTCKNFLGCTRDMKFVYVCLNSRDVKHIVSEDHHFVQGRDLLKRRNIELLDLSTSIVVT